MSAEHALRARFVGVEQAVPLADGSARPYVNFDNAASTPPLHAVSDAVTEFIPWYASVHRGAGFKSRLATDRYEAARETAARFVGADAAEHVVVFVRNTTEAINKLSYRLGLGCDDVVLVSQLEHHSNDLPWRARAHVVHIRSDSRGRLDEEHAQALLKAHAGRVRLLAITGGSNVTGHMPAIHRLAAQCHAVGARILVDAAQLAPHRRIAMGRVDDPGHIDYLAWSAHKMYAPFGIGVLVGRRDTFDQGEPECRGGGTIRFVSADTVAWAGAPERDEAGSPNVVGAVALAAAITELERIGMEAIAAHEASLVAHALRRLAEVPGLRLFGDAEPRHAPRRLGVIPFALDGLPHGLVAERLSAEHAIGVRNGCFCAHPYLVHLLGLDPATVHAVQQRLVADEHRGAPGLVRISFAAYNTHAEVDALVAALDMIARDDRREEYEEGKDGHFRRRAAPFGRTGERRRAAAAVEVG